MKKRWSMLGFLMLSLTLFNSCSDDNSTGPALPKVPTVSTASVSAITDSTADCGGTITSDGGAAVSVRGVCWSTGATPTTADNTTADGDGSGNFTSSLTGLTAGTPYYVRAYATNSVGTAYGSVQSFSTTAPSYQTISSTFDTNANGWTVSGGAIYYNSTGGNPGGFVEFEDFEDQCGSFAAPDKFRGDLSVYAGGTLGFDLKNTYDNSGFMLGCFGTIRISSSTLYAETNVVPYDSFFTDWTSFSISMTADAWEVTSEQWDSILTNVTSITILMDPQMGYYDLSGLDNFILTSPPLKIVNGSQNDLPRSVDPASPCLNDYKGRQK